MKPDYRNWMPRGMIVGLGTATGVLAAGSAAAVRSRLPLGRTAKHLAGAALGLGAVGCLAGAAWSLYARAMFSYEGGRQLSRQIIEGVASYIELPEGGVGLDVYEDEDDQVFQDFSDDVLENEVVPVLLSFPNVVITSHQAFFTRTALQSIAAITLENARAFARGEELKNEVKA